MSTDKDCTHVYNSVCTKKIRGKKAVNRMQQFFPKCCILTVKMVIDQNIGRLNPEDKLSKIQVFFTTQPSLYLCTRKYFPIKR